MNTLTKVGQRERGFAAIPRGRKAVKALWLPVACRDAAEWLVVPMTVSTKRSKLDASY